MRALIRLAWRNQRRVPMRSAVVVTLLAVIAGVAVGAVTLHNGSLQTERDERVAVSGAGDLAYTSDTPRTLRLPPSDGVVELAEVKNGYVVVSRGEDRGAREFQWKEADFASPALEGMVRLDSGRLPRTEGEVLTVAGRATPSSEELERLGVRVVGTAENTVAGPQLYAAPDTLDGLQVPDEVVGETFSGTLVVVRFDDRSAWPFDMLAASPTGPATRHDAAAELSETVRQLDGDAALRLAGGENLFQLGSPLPETLFSLALLAVGSALWVGLVAAAVLSIGARRRRRELGLLVAAGADRRQLRWAVGADGLVLGLLGGGLAILLGLVGSTVLQRIVAMTGGTSPKAALTPFLLLPPLAAVVAATGASLWAGRSVTRQPTRDLLVGRSPAMRSRSAPLVLGVGFAVVAWAAAAASALARGPFGRRHPNVASAIDQLATPTATVCVLLAVVLISASLAQWLPRLVRWGAPTLRLAARDLARFGTRTAAATAAIALVLLVGVAAGRLGTDSPGSQGNSDSIGLVAPSSPQIEDLKVVDVPPRPSEIRAVKEAIGSSGTVDRRPLAGSDVVDDGTYRVNVPSIEALTTSQVDELHRLGVSISWIPPSQWATWQVALVVAALALTCALIAALVLRLVRLDGATDERALIAQGADPAQRRRLLAARGALLVGVAAVVAVGVSAPVWALIADAGPVGALQWWVPALVLFGFPLIAGAVAALGSSPTRYSTSSSSHSV